MTTPPPSFHDDELRGFRSPWTFLWEALPGGLKGPGLQLIAAWSLAALLPAWFWARHLARFAGHSDLPSHWGERLPARDIVELWLNGEWGKDPIGTLPILALLGCILWALWAGWRMQAELLDRRPGLWLWILGGLEALLISLLPLWLAHWLVALPLSGAGGLGIAPLAWASVILRPLLFFACATALSIQWSLCRVAHLLGEDDSWPRHLGHSFLRLWTHPIHWTMLCLAGATLRVGLSLLVLTLAWRWGGASGGRVLGFALMQAFAAALIAWTLGWQLRLTALFTRHDCAVRAEQRRLQAAAGAAPQLAAEEGRLDA